MYLRVFWYYIVYLRAFWKILVYLRASLVAATTIACTRGSSRVVIKGPVQPRCELAMDPLELVRGHAERARWKAGEQGQLCKAPFRSRRV